MTDPRENTENQDIKLPPYNLEAEQAILGAVLLDNSALPRLLETRLSYLDFYWESHGQIFDGMRALFEKAEPVDLLTLAETLNKNGTLEKVGGPAYLSELVDAVATAANVEYYGGIVREKALLRRLITTAGQIAERSYTQSTDAHELLDMAESEIFSIREAQVSEALQAVDAKLLQSVITVIEERFGDHGSVTGIPTGFTDLDNLTSGFQPSDLIIIAGRPSMGKTALALNIAMNAAIPDERDVRGGDPESVAFFSLEMSQSQIIMRLLCSLANIDLQAVRTGRMHENDWSLLTSAAGLLSEAPLFIDDSANISVLDIRAKARRLKSKLQSEGSDLGMVMVDYLQLVKGSVGGRGQAESREREVSDISRSLKALAKELDVPVVALSQLNRQVEARPGDKRPILADLRESGSLEQDPDIVAFVFREEVYKRDDESLKGKAELLVRKQRNGPQGTVHMTFVHHSASFKTAACSWEEEY